MSDELRQSVEAAAARTEVRDAVADVYARLQQQVDQRKPVCIASGRCCKFDEYGHRLYVTTMELAAFVHGLAVHEKVQAAERSQSAGCPFQVGKLCGVHAIRPFGCRIFYCDPSATDWQQQRYEEFHAELKQLHEKFDVPYFYMEWREALRALGLLMDHQ